MLLVLKFRTVSWKTFKKTGVNHVHASAESLPFASALRVNSVEVRLDSSDGLDAILLVAVVVLEARIFDCVTLIEVILDLRAFVEVVFASDILTARFKTCTSWLATVFVAIPRKCLHAFLGSLSAFERASHYTEAFVQFLFGLLPAFLIHIILALNIKTFDTPDFIPVSNIISYVRIEFEGFFKRVPADAMYIGLVVQESGVIVPATRIKIQTLNSDVGAAFVVRKQRWRCPVWDASVGPSLLWE